MPFICSAQLASACSHSGIPAATEGYLGLRDRPLAGSPAQTLDWPKFAPQSQGCFLDSMFIATDEERTETAWLTTDALLAYFRDVAPWGE